LFPECFEEQEDFEETMEKGIGAGILECY